MIIDLSYQKEYAEETKKQITIRKLHSFLGRWIKYHNARCEIEDKASKGVRAVTIICSEKEIDISPKSIAGLLLLEEIALENDILEYTICLNKQLGSQP